MCPLLSPVPVRHSNNTGVHYICPFCRTLDNSGSLSARHARKADKKSVQAHRPVLAGLGRQRGKQRRALVVAELSCECRQRICNFPFELIAFYPQPPDAQVLSELSLPTPEIALETVQTALATHDFVHQVEPFTSNDQYVQFLWLSVIVFTGMSKSLSNNHSNRI